LPVRVYSIGDGVADVAGRYGAGVCDTLNALLDGSDVIDVCTPTYTHPEIVQVAAGAGKHVICEKPLALTHEQAAAMIRTCADAGVQLWPGQVVRFFGEYAAARAAVAAGRIGTPAVLRLSRRGPAPSPVWFFDEALSGGIMVDQMIHDIDFARWIAGEVVSVYSTMVAGPGGTVTAYLVLRHQGGALSHLAGAWTTPDQVFSTEFSLAGSAGLLRHTSGRAEAVHWAGVRDERAGVVIPGGTGKLTPFDDELAEFAAAIAGGPAPRVTAEDSLAALDIALAAAMSAAGGRAVAIEEVRR
jgi:myo-inositol 2-dehydrogenase/D-chiro-inositol 1-dehydrogenase